MQAALIPEVIGIAGPAGAGKDTVADLFAQLVPDRAVNLKFAGPLKRMTAVLLSYLGVPESAIEDRQAKEAIIPQIGVSVRHLMVTLGTEWGRQLINPNLWTLLMSAQIEKARAEGKYCLISDVRFDNEADLIRAAGGTVIHVVRPGLAAVAGSHASEAGVKPALGDIEILNDGSLHQLLVAVGAAFHGTAHRNVRRWKEPA